MFLNALFYVKHIIVSNLNKFMISFYPILKLEFSSKLAPKTPKFKLSNEMLFQKVFKNNLSNFFYIIIVMRQQTNVKTKNCSLYSILQQ